MVPTLSIAAIISRNLYKKTGNVWTPAFLNAFLMTTMALANSFGEKSKVESLPSPLQ